MSVRSQRAERILAWMLENTETWVGLNARHLVTHDRRLLVDRMKAGGVVAPTTYAFDVQLESYIIEARRRLTEDTLIKLRRAEREERESRNA